MPVTILNPHRSEPWANAIQGLSGALEAYSRYKSEDRDYKLRVEEAARRREDSEQERKQRDLDNEFRQAQLSRMSEEEKIREESERIALGENKAISKETSDLGHLIDETTKTGFDFKPLVLPPLGESYQPKPILAGMIQAPQLDYRTQSEILAEQSALSDAEFATPTGKLSPRDRALGREAITDRSARREATRQEAADKLRDTFEAPYDLDYGKAGSYKKGERVPIILLRMQEAEEQRTSAAAAKLAATRTENVMINGVATAATPQEIAQAKADGKSVTPWSAPSSRAVADDNLHSFYDKKTKENVMRTNAQAAAEPERYVSPKAAAATGEGGKPLLATEINKVSEFVQGLESLKALGAGQTTGTGAFPRAATWLPEAFTEFTGWGVGAKSRQAMLDTAKQIIGKAMEGGVLRKEDEEKYKKILPTIRDAPEVARNKMKQLGEQMARDSRLYLEVLERSGRNVSEVRNLFIEYGYDMSSPNKKPEDNIDPEGILTDDEKKAAANKYGLKKPGSR
jgi:hypothetical protein